MATLKAHSQHSLQNTVHPEQDKACENGGSQDTVITEENVAYCNEELAPRNDTFHVEVQIEESFNAGQSSTCSNLRENIDGCSDDGIIGDDGNDGDDEDIQNLSDDDITKFVLRLMRAKVKNGWSREEALSQLRNVFELLDDERVPYQNWGSVLQFIKDIGYENCKCLKVCFGEDHVNLLKEPNQICPNCGKNWRDCVNYYILGLKLSNIFLDMKVLNDHLQHWRSREEWFNLPSPAVPRKEIWHGERFMELSNFWDEGKATILPAKCPDCLHVISANDFADRVDMDNIIPIEHQCTECFTIFEDVPKVMRGSPLNQAFIFHEDGFNAFFKKSRSISAIQISSACVSKKSRKDTLQVYSFIPTCFIPEGVHHKLDAFFEPLMEEIVDLYISGITVTVPEPLNVNNYVIAPGQHTVRALLLLGTADIKAHQEIGLHAGGK